jgi:cell wall-associated NlpC family hydrolase
LTGAVFAHQGIELPRTAVEQFARGVPVAAAEMRPGDLVFFRNTYKHGISHVGIYVGEGRFIHAAGRRQGVIVSELARPYYQLRFAGARRLATSPDEPPPSLAAGVSAAASHPEPAAPAAEPAGRR